MSNFINTFKNKNRPHFGLIWIGWFVGGLCDILDGIINTITLCYVYPNFGMLWRFWISKKQLRKI